MIEAVPVVVVEVDGARQLWREAPEAMQQAVELADALIEELLADFEGSRIDTPAVDLAAGFGDIVQAVGWAVALDEALAELDWSALDWSALDRSALDWPTGQPKFRVSSGVDVGVLTTRVSAMSGRTFGDGEVLDSAAKLARDATPGSVGLGSAAADLLIEALQNRNTSWFDRLTQQGATATVIAKRVDDAAASTRATTETTRKATPKVTGGEVTRTNLPYFAGQFVGRAGEFNAIARTLGQWRLAALCGPAGAGKSRLAVEFGRRWMQDSDDGRVQAWFCDLSQVRSAREAAFRIARTTGVQIPSSESLSELDERMIGSFRERGRLLLILDDIDALDDALEESVTRWIERTEQLCVLTTGQRRPQSNSSGPAAICVDALGHHAALALLRDLIERPLPMGAEPEDAQALGELVESCGRLPLALELVARSSDRQPRPRPPGSRLSTGDGSASDELERALLRSWQMLDGPQKAALQACTVFVDSFSADAAISVIAAVVDADHDARELFSVLSQLSLLRSSARPSRAERHVLLAPVRNFASARADKARLADARHQHLTYFADWAHSLEQGLEGSREHHWLRQAQAELPNLYGAAAYGREVDLELYLTILEAIGKINVRIGPIGGFLERVDEAVEAAAPGDRPVLEMRARRMRAQALLWAGRYADAESEYSQAHRLAVDLGDEMVAAHMLSGVGFTMSMQGREEQGLPMVHQAVEAIGDGDDYVVIEVLTNAGLIARNRGHIEEATTHLHEALVRARRRNNAFGLASALYFLGTILRYYLQKWDEAIGYLREAYGLFSSIGDRRGLLVCYHDLAICYSATGRLELAERCYGEATELAATMGEREYMAVFWLGRGRSRFRRGEFAAAEPDLLEASLALEDAGHIHLKITTLVYLAATYGALDRVGEAQTYFARAEAIFEGTDITLEQPLFEVMYGYLEIALARAALRRGDQADALAFLEAAFARTRVDSGDGEATGQDATREALRLQAYLDECIERGELPAGASPHQRVLRVCEEMRWFGVDDHEAVDISRRGPIRRILRALVERRIDHPGETMTSEEVLEAGWPDEVLTAQSASQRLYTTISRMRSLGLQDVLETFDGEYLIPAAYTPVLVARGE